MTNKDEAFKPGDTVPISGIYDVIHDKLDGEDHAHTHHVTALRGEVFSSCRGCKACVNFRLHLPAEHIGVHEHFKD